MPRFSRICLQLWNCITIWVTTLGKVITFRGVHYFWGLSLWAQSHRFLGGGGRYHWQLLVTELWDNNIFSFLPAQSFSTKGRYIKKIRYHARGRYGIMHKKYCHYFVVLKEGTGKKKNKRRQRRHLTELERVQKHPQHIRNSLSWWWRLVIMAFKSLY